MSSNFIRSKFIEKYGVNKYEEFVLSLYQSFPLKKSLVFWQEKLLKELCKDLDIPLIEQENVHRVFNSCPKHNIELEKDNVLIVDGNKIADHIQYNIERKLFPLANVDAPRDLDRFQYLERIEILYCSCCREERLRKAKLEL